MNYDWTSVINKEQKHKRFKDSPVRNSRKNYEFERIGNLIKNEPSTISETWLKTKYCCDENQTGLTYLGEFIKLSITLVKNLHSGVGWSVVIVKEMSLCIP